MKELLQKLCEVYGPCGHEADVRNLIQKEIAGAVDDMRVDRLGNLIAVKRANRATAEPRRRIMVAAHMDEIGVMVSHVDEKGFLRFTPVGAVLPYTLFGSQVLFARGTRGTFGMEGKPLATEKPEPSKMFIDVGATDKETAPVQVGDVGVFRTPFVDLGNNRFLGPNFDDRAGCAVLVQALKEMESTANEIYAVFTVQEEVGVRGATTAAFGVEPDVALAIDVTLTGDFPEAHTMDVALGAGPAIKVMDKRMIAHPGVRAWLVNTAEALEIPYQLEVLEYGSTDAAAIQLSRSGAPAGAVSLPSRYIHTPTQMIDFDDLEHTVRLLVNALSDPVDLG
ncbi:MAG: M42 family peptidase [Caldilineae bacterium]|nr:MAG: M42 family peptidase [Caldilineae bacterium]